MRVYLTGATGFVGSNVAEVFSRFHGATVHGPVRRTRPVATADYTSDVLDLLDGAAVRKSVAHFGPDVVVHCAILNDWHLMYRDRALAWRTYVETTRTLARAANEAGARFVLVSSDWVFDGAEGGYAENSPPNPINLYGVLKMASELVALEVAHDPVVARLAGVNGVPRGRPAGPSSQDPPRSQGPPRSQDRGFGYFVATAVERLRAGERFTVWTGPGTNEVATPSLASVSADMMWRIMDRGLTGIFHCCGGEAVSRLELAHLAADVFGLDSTLVDTGPPTDSFDAPVPRDTSLSAQATAEAIDIRLPTARELLQRFRRELETGRLHPMIPG